MGSVRRAICFDQGVPQGQESAGGEQAGAQGAAGGALSQDMHRGGFPSIDLPMGSWSEPPRDILDCILDSLKEHRDILMFSSVCVAWRSFTFENLQRFPRRLPLARFLPQRCQLPLLMLPCKDATKSCDFFCVFEQKFYCGTPLPDSNKWIWGSSKGWLVTGDICGSEIYLFNPISRDQIHLPPATEIPRPKCDTDQTGLRTFYYLTKAVLSKSPASNSEECVVMGIISTKCVLTFCRVGDSKWTNVADSPIHVDDVLYYKEQFYAVSNDGVVVACDTGGPSPKVTAVVGPPKMLFDSELSDDMYYSFYLVESQGELLLVVRILLDHDFGNANNLLGDCRTTDFKVFRLQEKGLEDDKDEEDEKYETVEGKSVRVENSRYKWVELDNLCNQILFLGFNQSLSLPAGALPNSRGNCIYFVEDRMDKYFWRLVLGDIPKGRDDNGVFNMEDRSIHPFHLKVLAFHIPPVWNLQGH